MHLAWKYPAIDIFTSQRTGSQGAIISLSMEGTTSRQWTGYARRQVLVWTLSQAQTRLREMWTLMIVMRYNTTPTASTGHSRILRKSRMYMIVTLGIKYMKTERFPRVLRALYIANYNLHTSSTTIPPTELTMKVKQSQLLGLTVIRLFCRWSFHDQRYHHVFLFVRALSPVC